ncbi:MAG: glutathione peroxidase [Quisquiliibacterium sp.]
MPDRLITGDRQLRAPCEPRRGVLHGALAGSLALALPAWARAACPAFLDHSLQKLHSPDKVNLCKALGARPLLIVNTASHCGFTPQFKGLEALHKRYGKRGLAVVGFASDDFNQEARTEQKAAEVCYVNYGVTFTMIAPSHVKGDKANPVFRELNARAGAPQWNFNKYLVSADGASVQRFGSSVAPESGQLQAAIEALIR